MDDRHVNRRSDLRDDDHRLPLDDRHRMGYLFVDDLKMGVSSDVNLCHRMNDPLGDHLRDDGHRDVLVGHRANVMDDLNLVVNRVNRNYVRRDQKMVVMRDASRGLHMYDLLDDPNLDANRVNRNCVRRDRKMGGNSDVKNLHVMYY